MSDTTREKTLMELELPVEVWLASERVPLERLLRLEPGGILKLAKGPDEPVDLVVNGAVIATGELVVVDGHFGFRVTLGAQQRLAGLGAGEAAAGSVGDEPEPAAGPEVPATGEEENG